MEKNLKILFYIKCALLAWCWYSLYRKCKIRKFDGSTSSEHCDRGHSDRGKNIFVIKNISQFKYYICVKYFLYDQNQLKKKYLIYKCYVFAPDGKVKCWKFEGRRDVLSGSPGPDSLSDTAAPARTFCNTISEIYIFIFSEYNSWVTTPCQCSQL